MSRIAAFSKFHFHRQFSATFELSFHRYVQLARLKRASQQLAHSGDQSITDIALEAGYEAPDAFARAFRARLANRLRHSDGLPIGARGSVGGLAGFFACLITMILVAPMLTSL